jgi:tRNA1Val (adenine37-N6)-methyltransferase
MAFASSSIVACAGMATVSGGALGESSPFEATQDALFGGSLVLFQPLRGAGYRTNVDALLLAWFAASPAPLPVEPGVHPLRPVHPPTPIAFDLGAGVGAVGLALLRFGAARRVVLVEIDEQPAAMARRNLDVNGWADRGEVVRGDVRDVARSRRGEASLVVCNPPYTTPGRGQVRPSEALARCGDLAAFVHAARQVAGRRARVCFVYRAQELGALLANLADEGLHAKRMRFVHGTHEAPARVVLVEAQAGRAGGLFVLPPLVERDESGYTPEMESLLARESARE